MARDQSERIWHRAIPVLPGGVHNPYHYAAPWPTYFERSNGAYIFDVDGNGYLDLDGGHSSLPLGNNHPVIRAAIERQLRWVPTSRDPIRLRSISPKSYVAASIPSSRCSSPTREVRQRILPFDSQGFTPAG